MNVVDPAKVTRSALQNAASVAALFLTTEDVVVDIPKPPVIHIFLQKCKLYNV